MTEPGPEHSEFDDKKREYFFRLGLRTRQALKLHSLPLNPKSGPKGGGLWNRRDDDPKRERDWGNVSEHTHVAAARCEIFADLLGLSSSVKDSLMLAAEAHDFYKRGFKEATRNSPDPRGDTLCAEQESMRIIGQSGLPKETIEILNILGDANIPLAGKIVEQAELSELDLAKLALRYVDDYSVGSDWVETISPDGKNNLDRRVDNNEAKPKYRENSEQWRETLGGESLHEAQRRVGHVVEAKLSQIISENIESPIQPSRLPEFIDENIRQRISAM